MSFEVAKEVFLRAATLFGVVVVLFSGIVAVVLVVTDVWRTIRKQR